jgi:signal peptidase I
MTATLRIANRGATVALVLVLALLAGGVGLRLAGLDALVDNTDSMRPAIAAGDVVLTRAARAADLRPGQIATILDPVGGRLITHRVVGVARAGARVVITTRGDANDASERWALAPGAEVRRVAARIPDAGRPVRWVTAPALRLALAALGAALLAAAVLRSIWRPA